MTKINKSRYTGSVLNHLLDQKLSKTGKVGFSFSNILIRIPPIRKPLSTKNIATPSRVIVLTIGLYSSGKRIALCPNTTYNIAIARSTSKPKIRECPAFKRKKLIIN